MSDSTAAPTVEAPAPVMEAPFTSPEHFDEDNQPHGDGVGWGLSWGCQLTISRTTAVPDQVQVTVAMSDDDQRRGITVRTATADQVRDYAHQLLALVDTPLGDPGDGLTAAVARLVRDALEGAPRLCRYHGADFGRAGMWRGEPRCESCRQPWRVVRGLQALDVLDGGR